MENIMYNYKKIIQSLINEKAHDAGVHANFKTSHYNGFNNKTYNPNQIQV